MRRRTPGLFLFVALLVPSGYLAWLGRDMPQLGSLWDDGVYWVSAKSLADGSGYRILSLPGQPFQTKYPPLYPLVLSVVWMINPQFPENLPLAALLSWLMLPAFLLAAWVYYAQLGLGRDRRRMLVALLSLSPTIILLSLNLMSELMFSSLLLLCLSLAEKADHRGSRGWTVALAGALGGAAFLTRSAAAPLLVTVPVCLWLRRRRLDALLFFCTMAPMVLGWALWSRSHQSSGTDIVTLYYTNYIGYHLQNFSLGNLPSMLWRNLAGLLSGIGGLFVVNVNGSPLLRAFSLVAAILSIAGTVRLNRTIGATQSLTFTAAFLAVLALWHFPADDRYVMPVFPLLLAGLFSLGEPLWVAAKQSLRRSDIEQRFCTAVLCVVAVTIAATGLCVNVTALLNYFPRQTGHERAQSQERRQAHQWISRNISGSCGFLAHDDVVLYLDTGCPATRLVVPTHLSYSRDRQALSSYVASLATFMRSAGLRYVLLRASDFYAAELPEYGVPLVKTTLRNAGEFEALREERDFAIYFRREAR